jgi:polar amino acid transport system substrate-binding protein
MGVEIEFVSTAWDGIFTGLTTDKYDCIISSVSITPERLESYEFSKPYLSNGQVIVVKKGDASIASSADLGGKKVGVQLETTADIASQKQMEATPFELSQYDDIIQTFADLKTGRLDCIVVDYAVAIEYCAKNPEDYEITTAQLTNEPIAVCIKKGNTELKDKVNGAITALQEKGTMLSISDKWLGGDYVSNIDEELR